MPTLSLLILSLIVLGVALVALFFPIVAIPGAATTDVGTFTINGFWGSASTAGPPTGWSWGPGLGWWILLVAVVLGAVGAVLPDVKSIRAMIPSPPPGWRPSPSAGRSRRNLRIRRVRWLSAKGSGSFAAV